MHRNIAVAALALVPLATLPWTGCSSDASSPADAGRDATELLVDDGAVPPDLRQPRAPDMGPLGAPYPIVLVHGMAGFRNIGPLEYFYGVAEDLRNHGHDVWVSQQDPMNSSEVRGAELQTFVEMVLTSTGKAKVNLIGHSQGGFDVRYVASNMGDRVASVTTIASPMAGDPLIDIAVGDAPGPATDAVAALLDLYGYAFGYDSNAQACLNNLSTKGANAFFARHPDDKRVAYFSIAGRSEGKPGDGDCQTSTEAPFVARWDDQVDQLDPIFDVPAWILDGLQPPPLHDGLVPVGSARHGRFLGCIPADHLGEVGLPPGTSAGPNNKFDYLQFYRDLASFLVEQGY